MDRRGSEEFLHAQNVINDCALKWVNSLHVSPLVVSSITQETYFDVISQVERIASAPEPASRQFSGLEMIGSWPGAGPHLVYEDVNNKRSKRPFSPKHDDIDLVGGKYAARLQHSNGLYSHIAIDIDVPMFHTFFQDTGDLILESAQLSALLADEYLRRDGTAVEQFKLVSERVRALANGRALDTPFRRLALAYLALEATPGFEPLVDYDPLTLKSHLLVRTAPMDKSTHLKLTKFIAEAFFPGLYDKSLTAQNPNACITVPGGVVGTERFKGETVNVRRLILWGPDPRESLACSMMRLAGVLPDARPRVEDAGVLIRASQFSGAEGIEEALQNWPSDLPDVMVGDMEVAAGRVWLRHIERHRPGLLGNTLSNRFVDTRALDRVAELDERMYEREWLSCPALLPDRSVPLPVLYREFNDEWGDGPEVTPPPTLRRERRNPIRRWSRPPVEALDPADTPSRSQKSGYIKSSDWEWSIEQMPNEPDWSNEPQWEIAPKIASAPRSAPVGVDWGEPDFLRSHGDANVTLRRLSDTPVVSRREGGRGEGAPSRRRESQAERVWGGEPSSKWSEETANDFSRFIRSQAEGEPRRRPTQDFDEPTRRVANAVIADAGWDEPFNARRANQRAAHSARVAAGVASRGLPFRRDAEGHDGGETSPKAKAKSKSKFERFTGPFPPRTLDGWNRTNQKGNRIGREALFLLCRPDTEVVFCGAFGLPARTLGLRALARYARGRDIAWSQHLRCPRYQLSYNDWNYAFESIRETLNSFAPKMDPSDSAALARLVLNAALYDLGEEISKIAHLLTKECRARQDFEWVNAFRKGLGPIKHEFTSDEYADPRNVYLRQRKISSTSLGPIDPLANQFQDDGQFVAVAASVLRVDMSHLSKLPVQAQKEALSRAVTEAPAKWKRRGDLRQNADAARSIYEAAMTGEVVREKTYPSVNGFMSRLDEARERKARSYRDFELAGKSISVSEARRIVEAAKGKGYDPSTESFRSVLSLSRDIIGRKDSAYSSLSEVSEGVDLLYSRGEMALLKALVTLHVDSLVRPGSKIENAAGSRYLDFSREYQVELASQIDEHERRFPNELISKDFRRLTRDMRATTRAEIHAEDKATSTRLVRELKPETDSEGAFAKLLSWDRVLSASSQYWHRDDASGMSQRESEGVYFYVRFKGDKEEPYERQADSPFWGESVWKSLVRGEAVFLPKFSVKKMADAERSLGFVPLNLAPSSQYLSTEQVEDGSINTVSTAGRSFFTKADFTASALLLSVLSNRSRLSLDRSVRGLYALDRIMVSHASSKSTPITARYLSSKTGLSPMEANRFLQDAAAIGLISREGGTLRGTLVGPLTGSAEDQKVLSVCAAAGHGVMGEERVLEKDFVKEGQFLSSYTMVTPGKFAVITDDGVVQFGSDEVLASFAKQEENGDAFWRIIRSALRWLDDRVDREREWPEESRRKSNLIEVRSPIAERKWQNLNHSDSRRRAAESRMAMIRVLGALSPEVVCGANESHPAFAYTSPHMKGAGSESLRDYGFLIHTLLSTVDRRPGTPVESIERDVNSISRLVSRRSDVFRSIVRAVEKITGSMRTVELARRIWLSSVRKMVEESREFRRAYRANLRATLRGDKREQEEKMRLRHPVTRGAPSQSLQVDLRRLVST